LRMPMTFTRWAPSGTRLAELGGTSNSSNSTVMRPPERSADFASSDLIHVRAAPMPRVGEVVSLRVWRVPKEASFSTSDLRRSGETAAVMAGRSGGAGAGATGTSVNAMSVVRSMATAYLAAHRLSRRNRDIRWHDSPPLPHPPNYDAPCRAPPRLPDSV